MSDVYIGRTLLKKFHNSFFDNCSATYLEVTAVDPAGKSISQLGHVFTVQKCILVMKVQYELFADLQAPLGVCRQDARDKVV